MQRKQVYVLLIFQKTFFISIFYILKMCYLHWTYMPILYGSSEILL